MRSLYFIRLSLNKYRVLALAVRISHLIELLSQTLQCFWVALLGQRELGGLQFNIPASQDIGHKTKMTRSTEDASRNPYISRVNEPIPVLHLLSLRKKWKNVDAHKDLIKPADSHFHKITFPFTTLDFPSNLPQLACDIAYVSFCDTEISIVQRDVNKKCLSLYRFSSANELVRKLHKKHVIISLIYTFNLHFCSLFYLRYYF